MKMTSIAATAFLAMLLTGCGYTAESLHPAGIRTVAVPIFQNKDFRRGLEDDLTKELVKAIELRTPYKVTTQERADTVIIGTIDSFSESVLTQDNRDNITEVQMSMYITYQWKDLRTGRVIHSGAPMQSWYYASKEGQTLRSATSTAVQRLAERIVEDMEKDW
jgi:hypothetical protein